MSEKSIKRVIKNPYSNVEGYNCFGCSPNNEIGLRLDFIEKDEFLTANWEPEMNYAGYKNVLHGGIQATLLDEIASWCVQIKLKTAGVTSNLNLRYRKPVFIDQGDILLKAKIVNFEKRLADVETQLIRPDGEIGCEGVIRYFTYPEKIAREKLYYPDFNAFFKGRLKLPG